METKKVNDFTFVNETKSTRDGFCHISHLIAPAGHEIAKGRVNYLNRTWEYYRYQTSMSRAVDQAIADRAGTLKYIFKNDRNISRITKKHENDFAEMLNSDQFLRELYGLASEVAKEH